MAKTVRSVILIEKHDVFELGEIVFVPINEQNNQY